MKKLKIELKKSIIGVADKRRKNIDGLGLRHPGQVRVLQNTPAIRGMVKKVIELVHVEEINDGE